MLQAYNIADLREIARRRLPKGIFEFVDRGAEDEVALRNNRAAFERIRLKPRTLVDVSRRSQKITLFGKTQNMPMVIAPTGTAGLMWYHGEVEQARAAAAAGIPFTLSIGSTTALETVAKSVAGARLWFQVYIWPDRTATQTLVERARDSGYEALVVTVDSIVPGNREYNMRNGFTIPFSFGRRNVTDVLMHPGWMCRVLLRYLMTTGMPRYENFPRELKQSITAQPMGRAMMKTESQNWDDLGMLRRIWPHKLIVKGILHPDDAVRAADCGADAVVVSNHGGRNLDSSIAPIDALPGVVGAVGKRIPVLVDGGIRRGSDVIKALALGASAVQIGRPTLYGTAAAGEAGAARALEIFHEEIDRVLALAGCVDVTTLSREHLVLPAVLAAAGASQEGGSVGPRK